MSGALTANYRYIYLYVI